MADANPPVIPRVRVFVDYWNFQLLLNEAEAAALQVPQYRFEIDWRGLGACLAAEACKMVSVQSYSFDGMIIYTSYNPQTAEGRKFRNWATTWLDRQPGITVECFERKPKHPPKCPSCYQVIEYCPRPACGKRIVATVEKGVDTLIATDMIRLAWEDGYDIAVLASSDSDLIPAVKFLDQKARKVIQAGFPPHGVDLATTCWASFDVFAVRNNIRRASRP